MKKAFTLMEVIVSIAIIAVALVSTVSLISFSISGIVGNKSKITAFGLAQEGLEIVRNIRDNNWLDHKRSVADWRDGLEATNWRVQYNQQSLLPYSDVFLTTDNNGFYGYGGSTTTPFKRKITISNIDDNQLKVVAEVSWNEKGRDLKMTAESRLYNWLKEEE